MQIKDRTFLVTGGASGLGEATTRALLDRGGHVVVADRAGTAPEGAVFVEADVTDAVQVAHAVAEATRQPGPLSGVVNCAGIGSAAKVISRDGPQPLADFERIVGVNLIGTVIVIRLAAAIVNTASVAAYEGQVGQAGYSASKGGVVAMTLPIARELAAYGIRVNTIAPGLFLTPMMHQLPEKARASLGEQVPYPSRLGDPAEYAHLVTHIVENQMLNGETIRLDGAIRMAPR